jgi:flagellar protein FlaG
MNQAMRQSNRALEFSVDEESERLVVKLTDGETGEVIRQIPSDETLAISRYIADVQQGLLLSQKA